MLQSNCSSDCYSDLSFMGVADDPACDLGCCSYVNRCDGECCFEDACCC